VGAEKTPIATPHKKRREKPPRINVHGGRQSNQENGPEGSESQSVIRTNPSKPKNKDTLSKAQKSSQGKPTDPPPPKKQKKPQLAPQSTSQEVDRAKQGGLNLKKSIVINSTDTPRVDESCRGVYRNEENRLQAVPILGCTFEALSTESFSHVPMKAQKDPFQGWGEDGCGLSKPKRES